MGIDLMSRRGLMDSMNTTFFEPRCLIRRNRGTSSSDRLGLPRRKLKRLGFKWEWLLRQYKTATGSRSNWAKDNNGNCIRTSESRIIHRKHNIRSAVWNNSYKDFVIHTKAVMSWT